MRMESDKQNHAKFPSLDYPAIRFILLAISRAGTVDFLNKRREVSSRVLEIVCLFVRGVFVQNVRSSVVQSGSVHKPLQKSSKPKCLRLTFSLYPKACWSRPVRASLSSLLSATAMRPRPVGEARSRSLAHVSAASAYVFGSRYNTYRQSANKY